MSHEDSSLKVGLFRLPATAKCPQQQRKEASFLTQGEGEEEGEKIGEQP